MRQLRHLGKAGDGGQLAAVPKMPGEGWPADLSESGEMAVEARADELRHADVERRGDRTEDMAELEARVFGEGQDPKDGLRPASLPQKGGCETKTMPQRGNGTWEKGGDPKDGPRTAALPLNGGCGTTTVPQRGNGTGEKGGDPKDGPMPASLPQKGGN